MILPDTSVWVDHLRRKDETLQARLNDRSVLVHPFVIGEVALGHVAHRGDGLVGKRLRHFGPLMSSLGPTWVNPVTRW